MDEIDNKYDKITIPLLCIHVLVLKRNKCLLLINHTILCDIIHHIWEIKKSFTSVNDGEVIKNNTQCNFLKIKWYHAVRSCIIMIKKSWSLYSKHN